MTHTSAQERWNKIVGPDALARDPLSYAFVDVDPNLPNMLIIGDSISIGYTPWVRKFLAGKANVFRIPENGGHSGTILQSLDQWFEALENRSFKLILFNSGLHDLVRLVTGEYDETGPENRISLPAYQANLEKLVTRLHAKSQSLLWVSTSVLPEGSKGRRKGDEVQFNAAAAQVMTNRHIPIFDLQSLSAVDRHLYHEGDPKGVHYNAAGYERFGAELATAILAHL